MKVVLAVVPRASGEIERGGLPFLGVGYVASSLLLDGHDVKILDAHTLRLTPEETVQKILEMNPDVLGLSGNTHNRFTAIEVIKLAKKQKPNLKVVVGGPHFGLTGKDALKTVSEIDFVVKGEGELTARELLKSGFKEEKFPGILGIVYRDKNRNIIENSDRPFVQNLDDLPMPAWHLFDLSRYKGTPIEKTGMKTIGIVSSRGCPNQCIFCSARAFHRGTLRVRSPKNFVDEIEYLQKNYGYGAFNFWDDTFSMIPSRAAEICEEILRRKLKISWYTPCRVNTVDKKLLALMKKAGCVRVNFGIESGSPKILKVMKKGITMEQARAAIKAAVEVGLDITLNFLVVYPYETWEDIKMTSAAIKEFRQLKNVKPSYSFIIIYPGTELEEIAKKEKVMPENFSWNSPYKNTKRIAAGEDESVPYFEWPGLPFEAVKAFMTKDLLEKRDIFKRFLKKAERVRNFDDVKAIFKVGIAYLKTTK
ncbi:MAG: radical SAM protein [Candidatus Pacebacteria bacterium]|nr:radical SAM protein [Candidatus Paceibacterota bacterium]